MRFDVIVANITKNILIALATHFRESSNPTSSILLSGFYESDENDIINVYKNQGFRLISKQTKNNWSALQFTI